MELAVLFALILPSGLFALSDVALLTARRARRQARLDAGDGAAGGAHLACVIDEYGEAQGIVTLQDLVEAITGELHPHDAGASWAVQGGRYHALSGMIMLLLGRLPQVADSVDWEGGRFEIVDMDAKAIDQVLATRTPAGEYAPAQAPA